jgi:CheY-like chemotaxis protein
MKGANVLLVEDNQINQKIAGAFLRKWGYTVTVANDGREAVLLITSKNFQVVLMDLQMPEMDGYESTNLIRSMDDPYFKTIPIIAFSASCTISSREMARSFGMTDFINKPLMVEEFQHKIDMYL